MLSFAIALDKLFWAASTASTGPDHGNQCAKSNGKHRNGLTAPPGRFGLAKSPAGQWIQASTTGHHIDRYNNRRRRGPIGHIQPAEAQGAFHVNLHTLDMVAWLLNKSPSGKLGAVHLGALSELRSMRRSHGLFRPPRSSAGCASRCLAARQAIARQSAGRGQQVAQLRCGHRHCCPRPADRSNEFACFQAFQIKRHANPIMPEDLDHIYHHESKKSHRRARRDQASAEPIALGCSWLGHRFTKPLTTRISVTPPAIHTVTPCWKRNHRRATKPLISRVAASISKSAGRVIRQCSATSTASTTAAGARSWSAAKRRHHPPQPAA